MTTVAVLMPTKGRAAQMARHVGELQQQPLPFGVTLLVVLAICEDDLETMRAAEQLLDVLPAGGVHLFTTLRPAGETAVQGWNRAHAAASALADWFVLGADDIVWQLGWLQEALAVSADTGAQVIGLNDKHTNLRHYGPHYMVHRHFIDAHLGGVMVPPVYQSWWFDREVCEKAAALGLYAPAWHAVAEHLHPDWGTAEKDDTYRQALPLRDEDRATYIMRREQGFPVDYLEMVTCK